MDLLNVYEYKGQLKDVTNADVVVVYGNVYGDIKNTNNVVIINGNLEGKVINCDTILSDEDVPGFKIGETALLNKSKADIPILRKDAGIREGSDYIL